MPSSVETVVNAGKYSWHENGTRARKGSWRETNTLDTKLVLDSESGSWHATDTQHLQE